MKTYKYHFPAYGNLMSDEDAKNFKNALENRLNKGPNCLAAWCMFPSDNAILSHISFDINEKYNVTGINLYTYTQLNEGNETDLRSCIEENLNDVIDQDFGKYDKGHIGAYIEGNVKALGIDGKIPDTLYHIVEKEYAEEISKKGIDPKNGDYAYRNDNTTVYLCEKDQLAVWLSVLKHNENPVIMEVNTEGLNIELGRIYKDRDFAPDGYAEYRTTEFIPASAIKETELTSRFCAELHADMYELSQKVKSKEDFKEVSTGMQRLNDMGILKNADIKSRADVAMERKIPEVGMDEEDVSNELDNFATAVDTIVPSNTYKYRFPASGKAENQPTFTENMLEKKLKDGPDCLMAYCIFPTDSDILDHVSINITDGEITAIDLYTYTEFWDGMENDFKDCVQENLNTIAKEHGMNTVDGICIKGDVQALGRNGEIPETLYHITEQNNLKNILNQGLIPQNGNNSYKNYEDYVYLVNKQDIAPWLAILPNLNNPVILEVNTDDVKGIEPGRHFTDRSFTMPNGYGEYRTKNIIPSSNIKEMKLTEESKKELLTNMKEQLYKADLNDKVEVARGMDRLDIMGIHTYDYPDLFNIDKTEVTDTKEDNTELPWDSEKEGDALTIALGQMSLKDFGINY